MKNSSLPIYLVICFFIGFSCQKRPDDTDLVISDELSFILLTEGDSMFLVSAEKDRLVKEKQTSRNASASIYLSEDQKLLVLIGQDLDQEQITKELEGCLLNNVELAEYLKGKKFTDNWPI